jgi:integrase/recombinase XerD
MRVIVLLRGEGVIPVERNSTCKLSAVERCVQAYEQYLREARALARATIVNYVPFIRTGCVRHLMFLSHAGE